MKIGQSVLYVLPRQHSRAGSLAPAVVTKVNANGSVNLHVFRDPEDSPVSSGLFVGVAEGRSPGQCYAEAGAPAKGKK